MFDKLTYKQKLIGLIVIAILLFVTANKRSFSVTKQAYHQVKDLKSKLSYVNETTASVSQMQAELQLYDKVIGVQGVEPEEIQQKILDFSTRFDAIKVYSIEEIHVAEGNGFMIMTNQLTVEGSFNALSEMMYEFEKEFQFSNIVSMSFIKEKAYQTQREKLRAKVIFQNYEKIK